MSRRPLRTHWYCVACGKGFPSPAKRDKHYDDKHALPRRGKTEEGIRAQLAEYFRMPGEQSP